MKSEHKEYILEILLERLSFFEEMIILAETIGYLNDLLD